VWPGHYLSSDSVRGSGKVVIADIIRGEQSGSHEMIAPVPECRLIIIVIVFIWGYSAL
jgi:hypothetical protein